MPEPGADLLAHLWGLRAMTHRLGLATPPSTSNVRKQVGHPREPQRLLTTHTSASFPMAKEHKTVVVHYAPGHPSESVDALTADLNDGWRLASTTAMGGTGGATAPPQFAALVVLEREEPKRVGGFSGG